MRVLQAHNEYRTLGGEDTVLQLEAELLRAQGHDVTLFSTSNRLLRTDAPLSALRAGLGTVWSARSFRALREVLLRVRPDVIHVHNTFPQLSPSIYWAASQVGVPVVQTLHNYRLTCANGLLMRDGVACERCVGVLPVSALRLRCYRDSLAATGAVVAMQASHRLLGTYRKKVHAYIALTDFARQVMIRSGLPAERIHVKPNFVPEPSRPPLPAKARRQQVVFVGRVTKEKGLDLLLEAWSRVPHSGWRLVILGDGEERQHLEATYAGLSGVEWLGWLPHGDVLGVLSQSKFVVMPSRWYEGFPMVLVEALATGTPAVVPNHGPFPDLVQEGETGFLFSPGAVESLIKVLSRALRISVDNWSALSQAARSSYAERYSPEVNYRQLMEVYRAASQRVATQSKS